MGAVTATEPVGLPPRPLTVADLEGMPSDGHRYELLDGVPVVSPAPRPLHQYAVQRLTVLLDRAAPADLVVLFAPLAVRPESDRPLLEQRTELQPDLVVAARTAFTDVALEAAPLLAVEVLSPSTRLFDLNTKQAAYARMRTPSYWVADVDVPEVLVHELDGEDYRLTQRVVGGDELRASLPFPLAFRPSDLVGLWPPE